MFEVDFRLPHDWACVYTCTFTNTQVNIHTQIHNINLNIFRVLLIAQQYLTFNSTLRKCEILECTCNCSSIARFDVNWGIDVHGHPLHYSTITQVHKYPILIIFSLN